MLILEHEIWYLYSSKEFLKDWYSSFLYKNGNYNYIYVDAEEEIDSARSSKIWIS